MSERDSNPSDPRSGRHSGVIGWFAHNGVAANLLMLFIVVLGLIATRRVVLEVFPEISTQTITVAVPYLGAAPAEVEEAVCVRIEEAIQDLTGIKKVRSIASEGMGTVVVELETDADPRHLLDDIKSRVDAITTFPDETEKPILQEITVRRRVLAVAISGDTDERTLKHLAERVRDELTAIPGITQVALAATRPYEVSVEVSEDDLRRYQLTFDELVRAVQRSSLDLPGGAIRSRAGEILLRTQGQAYGGGEFAELVLRSNPDGTRILLGDVAQVVDGFAETDEAARFDGKPAALVQVYRVGGQSALEVARAVKGYVAALDLPPGIAVTIWQDDTQILRDRLDVLVRNGRTGLLMVFLVLALFLKLRLAGWVTVGIGVSFLGAVALMPILGVSVNVISLFAFIMVLGIVVDDAIVVGENIYTHFEGGKKGLRAAIDGTREVATPVTFSVLTTLAAFSPLISVPGPAGQIMRVIPIIVISCLLFSLIESLFILPNHLSHLSHRKHDHEPRGISRYWYRFQARFTRGLEGFVRRCYQPTLERALEWRYASLAIGLAVLLIAGGAVGAGLVKFEFFPAVEADNAVAELTMPQGTTLEVTTAALARIEQGAFELQRQLTAEGHPMVYRHVLATIGSQPFAAMARQQGPSMGNVVITQSSAHLAEVNIELEPAAVRGVRSPEVARRWRELTGPIPEAVELSFSSSLISFGSPIDVELAALDRNQLLAAALALKDKLRQYPGVSDIADSYRAGKREVKIDIQPRAESLGLTLSDLARQVRQGFYGAEAQRIQRGRDDVRVMVRYPPDEREDLGSLEQMRIRTANGGEVPFASAGTVEVGRGFAAIQRTNRRRTMNVTADVDPAIATANEIAADLSSNVLPELLAQFPGVSYSLAGEQEEQRATFASLGAAFGLALIMIYGLLAIPFRSYLQPLIVMSAIPFGLVGAIIGHQLLGMSLTMLSLFGLIALTGVVVNDSLVMVDFINRRHRAGTPLDRAIREAGAARFRPILLTSVTTFAGLTPLLLEKSLQAQFLIPMAVSLAFGVVFATAVTLLLVPVLYRILEDVKQLRAAPAEPPAVAMAATAPGGGQ